MDIEVEVEEETGEDIITTTIITMITTIIIISIPVEEGTIITTITTETITIIIIIRIEINLNKEMIIMEVTENSDSLTKINQDKKKEIGEIKEIKSEFERNGK